MSSAEIPVMNATRFFEMAIPFFAWRSARTFVACRGVLHFSIEGEGSWTVQLGNIEDPIKRGLVGRPDLAVWYSRSAFDAFLAGTMNAREVVRSGEFCAKGDASLLEQLGGLFADPGPRGHTIGLA